MNTELQQILVEFTEEIIENRTESRSKGLPSWKRGIGILPGDASYLFGEIIERLLRDDKTNYLRKRDLEDLLWEFVHDIKTNPQSYSSKDDILYETERFYSEIAEEDKEYEILLPLENVGILEEISIGDFELRIFDQKLAEEWGLLEWGLSEKEKEEVVLLTTVKANSSRKAVRRGKHKCFSFLALIQILPRIYKGSKISPIRSMYVRRLPHNHITWVRLDGIPQKTFLPMEGDMNYLQEWSNLLVSHPTDMTKRVIAGIKLLAETHTEPEIVMKLIKVFMALETVFTGGKRNGKKSKLIFRVILFLSRREKGFPFPPIILYLYDKRNAFMHEATEIELPEVEQLELEEQINEIMTTSRDVYLELLRLMSENPFENHSSFILWLLEEDDTYKAVNRSFGGLAEKRLEIALAAFNGKSYELAKQFFNQARAIYRSTGNSTKSRECNNYYNKCREYLEKEC